MLLTAHAIADVQPFDVSEVRRQLSERPVVIFGAGKLGRKILKTLQSASITPRAFSDNNPALWGKTIESVEVLSPAHAARTLGDRAIFAIAIWHPSQTGGLRGVDHQLRELGCTYIVPFVHVLWAFPGPTLPHYLWDLPSKIEPEWDAIRQAADLFEDETSQAAFAGQVAFRLTADYHATPPIATHPQYFPEFLSHMPKEHFVDCGAYDGDSVEAFLEWSSGRFKKLTAFEPDPDCFRRLKEFVAGRSEAKERVDCQPYAVSSEKGLVRFDASGFAGAAISNNGSIEVNTIALDDFMTNEEPTFIKMDIESAEPEALRGAKETIRRTQPVLAICVYHTQNHLWRLPLLMKELMPDARFFLRSYCLDGLDTVCYAVPRDRLRLF